MADVLRLAADREGERLDQFVARCVPEVTRSHAQRLIEGGLVTVNGRPAKPGHRLAGGEAVAVTVPEPQPAALEPEPIPLTVVYQDADVLVVDKPPGLPVHPSPGHERHTLVNAVLALCPDLRGVGGDLRPGIVHRLDMDTSGLLAVAKNDRAHQALSRQLQERTVHKVYLALVEGRLRPPEGIIDAPVGRDPRHRQKMAVVAGGREARTRYRVRQELDGCTLVEAEPVTGRTHQIRVHMAALGHPVVGDPIYGRRSALVPRQFLHAWRLGFRLPSTGEYREFESPLPPDLRAALRRLETAGAEAL
ncbi:MAG TPA: RluA family pseudouridine synthase [Dehalococcoidia bacterium]